MTGPQRRFDPAELRIPGEPEPTLAEQADTLSTARDLESLALGSGVRPTDGFEDRVMAAIAAEPAPRLVVVPASTVRGGVIGAFLLTVRQSWAIAMGGGRPMGVRVQALAFVLLVVLAAGALTGVTALTVGALIGPHGSTVGPDRSSLPTAPVAPVVSPSAPASSDSPEPSGSPEPAVTTQPTATTETPDPTETARSTGTPKPAETPRATRTPRPTQTPRPTETPNGTDDHGGGGGGSDGGGKGPG